MDTQKLPDKDFLLKLCYRRSNYLSLVALSLAFLTFIGYIFQLPVLTYFHPSLPPMQPNTVMALIMCSVAVFFINSRNRKLAYLSAFLGAIAILLGVLTLVQYYFFHDLGIDQIFSPTPLLNGWVPGRPAPQTAANFILLGLSLIIFHSRRISVLWTQGLTLLALGNSIVVFTGYIFSTKVFFGFPYKENAIGMAINTSLAFICLCLALLFSSASSGLMSLAISPTRSGAFARKFFYTCIVVSPLLAVITDIGMFLGYYSQSMQVSLYITMLVGWLIWTTWIASVKAEKEEIIALNVLNNLSQSEERFELALSGADLGAWDWNIKTGDVVFTERWAKMRGYSLAEIKPHVDSWIAGIHKEDLPVVQSRLRDYFEGKSPEYETEFRVQTKSGEWIWVLDKGKIFEYDVDGKPLRMVGTEFEITSKKRLENEQKFLTKAATILSSSIQYEETIKSVCDLAAEDIADLCIVDIVDTNANPVKRVVSTRDSDKLEICKKLRKDKYDPGKPSIIKSVYESKSTIVIKHVDYNNLDLLFQNKSCHEIYRELKLESIVAVPLILYGNIVGMLSFMRFKDSGAFNSAEIQLAEKLGDLAAVYINNSNLYLEAKQATRVREEVLAIVSHDLKNPLSTVGLVAQMLKHSEKLDSSKMSSLANNLDLSSKQMKFLISNLLDFAKLQSGTFSVDLKPTNLSQVINDVLEILKLQMDARNQNLEFEIPSDLMDIQGDGPKLEQVFSNLLGNAIKFSPEGSEIKIKISQNTEGLLISITDNGPGISPELIPHIFDRYWQPKDSRNQGSGLGLSIAKGIVDAHQGKIWVESASGVGSTFFVFLPFK